MAFNLVSLFTEVIRDLQVANFNAVSVTALMAYEITITIGQEIKYIWGTSWNMVKVLYFTLRYYPMFYLLMNSFVTTNPFLSQRFCHYYNHFQIWGTIVVLPLVDCLIVARIYALYGQSKKMGFALGTIWLSEIIISLTLLGFAWTPFESIANPLPGIITGCVTNFTPRYTLSLAFWGVSSAFQAVYVAITFFKMFGFIREFGISKAAFTPLLTVFFRDGAAYFLIIFASNLLNTFIERFGSILLAELGTFWGVVIPSITACRLVLNLRIAVAPANSVIAATPVPTTQPDMRFFEPAGESTLEV